MTHTQYAARVNEDISRELTARLAVRRDQYGPDFIDVLYCNPNGHGPGRMSLSFEFGNYCTSSPMELKVFAHWAYGTGRLRRLENGHYLVLAAKRFP